MDKKGSRNVPTSLKGITSDCKKNQDGVSSKALPRSGRRRETPCGSGGSSSNKSEPSRKPQPQRVKTAVDKRPKTRGGYHPGLAARNETSWIKDNQGELGSVFSPGSKKQSLNHLLNFSYAPREVCQEWEYNKASSTKLMNLMNTRKHKYNKEHFLQANCRFIVNCLGDYKQYMRNPDALVDWNLVEQVNVQVSEFPSCPICLYPPVAAKVTKCGHIYCWSCILHYLALSDKSSRKCPICYEAVHRKDLKSVIAIPHTTFKVDEKITLTLMKRPKGCLTAYPVDAEIKDKDIVFGMSEQGVDDVYSKLLIASKENVIFIIEREYNELVIQLAENEDCPEKCFIEQALELLNNRRATVLNDTSQQSLLSHSEICFENVNAESVGSSLRMLEESVNNLNLDDPKRERPNSAKDLSKHTAALSSKLHYFYQACDGQHIYLHAINAKMLEHTYGSLEFGPKSITGKILEKESGSMTENLRKRLRYLEHLPVTCQFEVAEIQLVEPVVSKDTMDFFHDQIETRKKARQRRAKEEKRRERRIESEGNKKLGKYPTVDVPLDSQLHFPEWCFDSKFRNESDCTLRSERILSPELPLGSNSKSTCSLLVEPAYQGPSFASVRIYAFDLNNIC